MMMPRRQRGVILIPALIIVASATVLAAAMFFGRDDGESNRGEQGTEQALQVARAPGIARRSRRGHRHPPIPNVAWAER